MLPSCKIKQRSNLIPNELISVQPLPLPNWKIPYFDFFYDDTLEQRYKKMKKIIERMGL